MRKLFIALIFLVSAGYATELAIFEGSLQQDEYMQNLDQMQVVFESAEYFVAFIPDGLMDGHSQVTVLDSGDISPAVYALVHLVPGNAQPDLSGLGETVMHRGEVAIVRLAGRIPEPYFEEGVFFVQPLRVINVRRALDNPFQSETLRGPDDDIADIVASVSEDSILAFIQHLEDYQTRYSSTDNYDTACNWVQMKFESYGLQAEQQTFPMSGYDCQNVIAELPGVTDSTKIYIICGHLDSITYGQPEVTAPGADDNASGSTAVLEAARILSGYEFNYTLRFICFGGEEQGLWGSEYYANQASSAGDDIIGVVNLDMVLYGPSGQDVFWVPYNTQSEGLALALEAISDTYVPALTVDVEYSPSTTYSDHSSFWNEGYAAILGIEQEVFSNPYYHQTTDLLANYVQYFPFGTNCIKGAIATVAYLAEPTGVGIEQGESFTELQIASVTPNPAGSLITVRMGDGYDGNVDIAVFDITGRRVMSGNRAVSAGAVELDVSALPPGVYGLRITAGDVSEQRSMVIAR